MRLSIQNVVWALDGLCALHKVPFDAQLLIRNFVSPYGLTSLQSALQTYGFQVGLETLNLHNINPAVFPILLILKPEVQGPSLYEAAKERGSIKAETKLAIILKCDEDRMFWKKSETEHTVTINYSRFSSQVAGQLLLVSKRSGSQSYKSIDCFVNQAQSVKAGKNNAVSPRLFGFKRFIPERPKHKSFWRNILSASLAIQLVALISQLDTQAFIDKVVFHHTKSTIILVAFALGIFILFNAVISLVRQYLVSHTVNRIGAMLAHKLLGHLCQLPIRYFERQRIAIARALLRQPNIPIFDEAVSKLNPPKTEQFAQIVFLLKGKMTILFITHQLPNALQVNEVVT